jgi:ribonuclease HI
VATKINVTYKPTHSVHVTPNPPESSYSPTQQGEDTSPLTNYLTNHQHQNDRNYTTNVITTEHPFNRNTDDHNITTTHSDDPTQVFIYNQNTIATDLSTNVLITEHQFHSNDADNPITNPHSNTPTQHHTFFLPTTRNIQNDIPRKQYLISQYFKSKLPTSTNRHNITATAIALPNDNNISSPPHTIHQQPTTSTEATDLEATITNTRPVTNTITTQASRQRKNYVQQHILQKPIPNDYWGSSMDTSDPSCFRIFFQNINGLTAGKSMERWHDTVTTMHHKKCEIFGLAETNTNWESYNIKTNINRIINRYNVNSSTNFSCNRYNPDKKSRFQPGGTLQSCTGHWKSRCISTIHDLRNMGRWTGQIFQLKNNKTLTVITAYRPCKQSNNINNKTSSTTYRQQTIMLTEEGFINPDPRKFFIDDIIIMLQSYQLDDNNYTILMMDANENVNDSEGGLARLIQDTNLIDVFSLIGTEECNTPTYVRGNKKIDYILTSESLSPFIKNVGCLPFYIYNNSDHRGLFIDVSEELLDAKVELQKPKKRHIGTNCSGYEIYQYKKYIDKQFQIHQIYDKTNDLQRISNHTTKRDFEKLLNALDKTITEIVLAAEKKCSKPRHESNWSVELHIASIMCNFWLKKFKGYKNNMDVTAQTKLLFNKLPETIQDDISALFQNSNDASLLRLAKQQLRININIKKQLIANHQLLRRNNLENFKKQQSIQGNQKEADIIGKIATTEMRKADWLKLRHIFNPKQKSGISNIEVPDKDEHSNPTTDPDKAITWRRIYDPQQVETYILERNIKHFGQAEGSLFTRHTMTDLFDYDGTTPQVNDLLQGNIDINSIPAVTDSVRTLLQTLSKQNALPRIDNCITLQEFTQALRKWNEATSTSPSGRHLGHYKVLLRSDYCDELYHQDYCDPKEKILKVYYDILTQASLSGISIQRWQNSTTAMIEKLPGCPKINKLRVIHLYEADYNIILKIIWARKLVWNAHDNDCIHEGQAGSRPGCNAIDVVIQKEMKYLYSRLSKTNLATMDNDAKSCYDRIICNLAMIISQYYGVTRNMASLHATTLRKMKYRLRTALGSSTTTYQHSNSTPIHGTGQGSCASPAIWLLISSILMDCLSALGGGMTMIDVQSEISIQQWIDGFVDDTSLFTNIIQYSDNDNITHLCTQLTHDMTTWNELLEASGGKLELSKCFYYILSWKFDKEGNGVPMTILEQRNQHAVPIQIKKDNKDFITIQQKEVNTAHKTLGCFKAIDGNEKAQIKYLSDKSRQFGRKLYNTSLTRKQAIMAYKTIYIPSMRYGLPACSLSHDDIESIQKSTLDKFLPFMGFEHGSPRALVHGPQEMGGYEIPHLYTEMMGLKIESIIAHIRADTILGKSFRININYLQLICGLEQPIFSSRDNIGYITGNWLSHLREYLLEINGTFIIKDLWTPTKLRENDIVLMTEFLSLGLNKAELRLINNWRIYFQVTTLAELCNPEGKRIRECFIKIPTRPFSNQINRSTLQWPKQGIPGKRGFSLWLKCLRSCFNMANNGRIHYQFGKWAPSEIISKNNSWNHFFQVSSGALFSKSKDGYYYISPESRKKSSATYKNDKNSFHRILQLPTDCIPISLRLNRTRNLLIATFSHATKSERLIIPDQPQWTNGFIENIIVTDSLKFKTLFSQPEFTIYIASDGGVFNYEGTFGVLLSDGLSPFAQNNGKFYSVDFCESSYRSELFAMLSGVLSYKSLRTLSDDSIGAKVTLKLISDSRILVNKINKRLQNRRTTNQHRDSDVDLELQLVYELEQLISNNHQITISFVRSHQELQKLKSALSHSELLNVMADGLTKSARKIKRKAHYTSLPRNPIDFTINNITVNSKYSLRSKKSYHSIHLREYFRHKHSWPNNIIDSIWWKPYHLSLSKLSSPEKTIIYKFIHDRLPTKARENKYYSYRDKQCTQCQSDHEDEDHILKCFSIKRQHARIEWMKELDTYLSQNHTPQNVKHIILYNVRQLLEASTNNDFELESDTTDLDQANRQQSIIGWRHFIRGRISIYWGKAISLHLAKEKLHQISAEKWAAALFHINWKHILKIWRERCTETHGNNPTDVEQKTKNQYLEHIRYIQTINQNLHHSTYDWILEDIEDLRKYTSKNLQTWLYGAKIISRHNQSNIKQQLQINRQNTTWHNSRIQLSDKKIEKGDLDPGE